MIYTEEVRDLFSVPKDYYLAHCISADFGMGRGIVIEFNKRFDMKNILMKKYPDYLDNWSWCIPGKTGDCILEGRVLNLITKERYFHKPTYDSMQCALAKMRMLCQMNDIKKVAMPIIGCGLDRLDFNVVSEIIKDIFKDEDIEILVCRQ